MLKIYLVRLESEQKPPLRKARWHRLGAQQKVPALPLLRKDKGGNFFGKKTNPRKTQQTVFPNFPPPATPRAVSVLSLASRESLIREGGKGVWQGHPAVPRRAGSRARRSAGGEEQGRPRPAERPFAGAALAQGSPGSITVASRRSEALGSDMGGAALGGGGDQTCGGGVGVGVGVGGIRHNNVCSDHQSRWQ